MRKTSKLSQLPSRSPLNSHRASCEPHNMHQSCRSPLNSHRACRQKIAQPLFSCILGLTHRRVLAVGTVCLCKVLAFPFQTCSTHVLMSTCFVRGVGLAGPLAGLCLNCSNWQRSKGSGLSCRFNGSFLLCSLRLLLCSLRLRRLQICNLRLRINGFLLCSFRCRIKGFLLCSFLLCSDELLRSKNGFTLLLVLHESLEGSLLFLLGQHGI